MADERAVLKGIWEVIVENHETGEKTVVEDGNIVVNLGRENILKEIFGIVGLDFLYLNVGSGSTAATAADTSLVTETTNLNGGSLTTRINLTDASGGVIDAPDVVPDVTLPPYTRKIVVQGILATTDNNGTIVREIAIFSSDTFGAGTMLNRFVLGADISKTSAISITINITLRI
jgi:hypothetical protein